MVFDDALVAAGDEDEMGDSRFACLVDRILDEGAVNHRQHLFRHGLRGRQEARSKSGDRENGSFDTFYHGFLLIEGNNRRIGAREIKSNHTKAAVPMHGSIAVLLETDFAQF
jgi:hypothetical protein